MDNLKIVIDSDGTEYAIIEHADGSFTSMTKAHYDELKANEAKIK
jgi:hypothetical protein